MTTYTIAEALKQRGSITPNMARHLSKRLMALSNVFTPTDEQLAEIAMIEKLYKKIYIPCDGAAHSNPFIDGCLRCMPMWGVMPIVGKIRERQIKKAQS